MGCYIKRPQLPFVIIPINESQNSFKGLLPHAPSASLPAYTAQNYMGTAAAMFQWAATSNALRFFSR